MSTNRGDRACAWCDGEVIPDEPIVERSGLLHAHCRDCMAQYLAYMDGNNVTDTSFRSTFNDEPGISDFPQYAIRRGVICRIPWSDEVARNERYSRYWEDYVAERRHECRGLPQTSCSGVP